MKFVIDIRKNTYEKMVALIEKHGLENVSKLVEIAIENQLALDDIEEGPLGRLSRRDPESKHRAKIAGKVAVDVWKGLRSKDIPWDELEATEPTDIENYPLWGQYNRFLPIKVAVRVLARQLATREKDLPLTDFYRESSRVAIQARQFLETVDYDNETPRGERFSTGFPEGTEKSTQRFQAHFIGYLQKDGTALGALPQLGLVSISPESGNSVSLTETGLELAHLPNPLIDEDAPHSVPLSPEEVGFLLSCIKRDLPAEFEFITNILLWISEDAKTPEELTRRIQRTYSDWSYKVANSMRTGALGRMHDLGLIARRREGREVTYELRPRGSELVKKRGK